MATWAGPDEEGQGRSTGGSAQILKIGIRMEKILIDWDMKRNGG